MLRSAVRTTVTPSGVETKEIPNRHITSLPIRLIGHEDDRRNKCLNLPDVSSSHNRVVYLSRTVFPEAPNEFIYQPLIFGDVGNISDLITEFVAPESTRNVTFVP